MDIDPRTRKTLLENVESSVLHIDKICQIAISRYRKAKTVEEILSAKRNFVVDIVKELPHGSMHCYFCTLTKMGCEDCGYAKIHGSCGSSSSTYSKLCDAKNAFISAMEEFHRDDQKYE